MHYGEPEMSSSPAYQPAAGPPGSGQPFTYAVDSSLPDQSGAASYYAKYSSAKTASSTSTTTTNRAGPSLDRVGSSFPHQPAARSPTPQSPPKRVDDLMSEFREFESVHGGGGSPTPPMFAPSSASRQPTATTTAASKNSTVVVTELADEEDERPARLTHQRPREDAAAADSGPAAASGGPKGPAVYYPPGADFSKSSVAARPVADGGSMSLEQAHGGGGGKGQRQARAARGDRYGASDGADKQGAAVIPICLPLCCAAPCVIM